MSIRKLSPTANLFRSSRLFSLPPPSPRPAADLNSVTNYYSDTATTPYPTHAAIETTQSSLSRGDWGLKRALPLKSTTKSSTPVIHIDNIDSIDHVTDFGSAADHTVTLQKWQELDVPLSINERNKTASRALQHARSAFDPEYDNTEIISQSRNTGFERKRWKFEGPWLAGKTDGDFSAYVQKKIKKRRPDFRHYLATQLCQNKAATQQRIATEEGRDLGEQSDSKVTVSEAELKAFIRQLRSREADLHKLIEEYLDLPREKEQSLSDTSSQFIKQGPPITHPSAGLSYLRTDSFIYNHPDLGPQENRAPVQGRVIVPQKTGDRMNPQALIGVAGVVGKDSTVPFFDQKGANQKGDERAAGVNHYDPDIPGGGKLWTQPRRASIDSHGQIIFSLDRADKNALNVAKGVHSEETTLSQAAIAAIRNRELPDLSSDRVRSSQTSLGYGLEELEPQTKSGRATPFLGPDDDAPPNALNELLTTGSLKAKR